MQPTLNSSVRDKRARTEADSSTPRIHDSHQGRCDRRQSESANRPIVAVLVGLAVVSLAALGVAFTHGFIP